MNIRVRILALICGIIVLGSGLAVWQLVGVTQDITVDQSRDSALREATLARQLIQLKNKNYQDLLFDVISREQSARTAGMSSPHESSLDLYLENSPFWAVAILKADKGQWQAEWYRQRSQLKGRWPEGFLAGVLKELPADSAIAGNQAWFRLADSSQQPLFAMLMSFKNGNEQTVAVGLAPSTIMQSVTESFVGSKVNIAVVDERGFALAYDEQAYVGANISESEPLVAEALKSRAVAKQFQTTNREKQKVQAAALKIDGSNLYVVTAVATPNPWTALPRLGFLAMIFGLALLLIGAGLGVWIMQPLENAVAYLSQLVTNVAAGNPNSYFEAGNPLLEKLKPAIDKLVSGDTGEAPQFIKEATAHQVDVEKMSAYKEISLGLAQALKDPLASVLAQTQLARARAGSPELKEHFVVIERETRRARDTMDELLKMTGEEKFPRSKVEVQDVVLSALAAQRGLLSSHNVKIHKELGVSIAVQAHAGQLQTALEELIKNSVEAMKDKSDRQLKLTTSQVEGWLQLKVEDNGSGVKSENLDKIFDPFFTTKDANQHKGLGLTVAKGILKGFGGRLRIESTGQGAVLTLEFPAPQMKLVTSNTSPNISAPRPEFKVDLEKPLTGTDADHLPTAPSMDEVTLTNLKIQPENALPAEQMTMRPPKIKEGNS